MAEERFEEGREIPGRWSQRKRDIGIVVWIAFLAASVGTVALFAVLDPDGLNEAWVLPWEIGRRLAYSLGFLFLFVVSLIAAALTAFMIRTGPRRGHAHGRGQPPVPETHSPEENNPDLDIGDFR